MPTTLPIPLPARPFDGSPDEIESRAELADRLATGSLANLTLQGLDLRTDPPDLTGVDLTNTLFLGCRFTSRDAAAEVTRRGADVVPSFDDLPYPTHPGRLYTADDLAEGFTDGPGGFEAMYDTRVFRHFLARGGPLPAVREALTQRLHDSAMDNALLDASAGWLASRGHGSAVGVMGGHAEPRGSAAYRMAAALGHRLAGSGRLVITGGGPGVMEAANLGAFLGARPVEELTGAIDRVAASPDFTDHDRYTAAALAVRRAYPRDLTVSGAEPAVVDQLAHGGLAIPTWLYGHEPANLFAGGIAKYFSNAIREDTILRLARGGIVFAPGRAGTLQEVFQAATRAFYQSDGPGGPFIFLGSEFWAGLPAPMLLATLLAGSPHGDLSGLVRIVDDVDAAMALLGPPAGQA